jgi:DHA2 family multidrug resistance protein
MTVVGFVLYGSMVVLPIFLQTLLGYPAVTAGITMAPRGLGSFCGMPLVGVIIGKFDPRKLLAAGLVGAAFSLMSLARLNLDAGYWDLFWPQFFQGISMALLFVPLTTVTMDAIPKEEMGNATSLFNLMRNIGGSVGIAVATTMIARSSQKFTMILGRHVNPYSLQSQEMFERLRAGFMARGMDATTAAQQAYAAMFGMVQRQAALLSYLNTFWLFGVVFLLMLPLILLLKRPAHTGAAAPMH